MTLRTEENPIINNRPAFDIARDCLQEFATLHPKSFCKIFGHRIEEPAGTCRVCGTPYTTLSNKRKMKVEIYKKLIELEIPELEKVLNYISTPLTLTSTSSSINLRRSDELSDS